MSFSGGQTSAYMAHRLISEGGYDQIRFVFANTGQEREETLDFVHRCDLHFGLNVVWLEAVVHHGERVGTTHKIVNYSTASRAGDPFEEVIKKYGIPNQAYPHCTRELKLAPIRSWVKSCGLEGADMAVGIRADEIDRMQHDAVEKNIIYPLVRWGVTQSDVNRFWDSQPFRLGLKGYQGNCSWCWKKSLRKHFTLIKESPEIYDFPARMEKKHGLAGYNEDGNKRVFFRKNTSTKDLIAMSRSTSFAPAIDDSQAYNYELDLSNGCTESCEVEF